MEILIKKDGSGKSTLSELELKQLLKISELQKKIQNLEKIVSSLQKKEYFTKEDILNISNKEFLKINEPINISSAQSIEKIDKIPEGVIYYNSKVGCRIKTKTKWATLKLDSNESI